MATAQNPIVKPSVTTQELPRPKYQWFTDCPQDWFIMVVRGGDLYKIIHSVKGWYVDEKFEFQKETGVYLNIVTPFRAITGFEFVGIPGIQGMKVVKSSWNKFWRTDENSPIYQVTAHDPELVYIFPFESQYPLTFPGIDVIAKDRLNNDEESIVDVTFVVTVRTRTIRPRVTYLTNTDWLGNVLTPKLQTILKDFAGGKNYDQLITGARETITQELHSYVMGQNSLSHFKEDMMKFAGVDILDFSLVDIKPNKTFEDAQNRLAEKQKEAQGIIALAEANKKAKELDGTAQESYEAAIGRGKATGIKAIREAAGSDSETYIKWDRIRDSKITTFVEAGAKAGIIVGTDGKPIN